MLPDAGYCHPAGIAAVVKQQADVCVRLNPHALPLYDERGEPFSITTAVAGLRRGGQAAEWPVEVRSGAQRIAGRVCAIRKSQAAIDQAHRRLREKLTIVTSAPISTSWATGSTAARWDQSKSCEFQGHCKNCNSAKKEIEAKFERLAD